MRLLRFRGSVKFRRGCVFRWNLPSFIERGSARQIGCATAAEQEPEDQREYSPASSREDPVGEAVPLAKTSAPFDIELPKGEPGSPLHRNLEVLARSQQVQQRGECMSGVAPRELGNGRGRQGVSCIRRCRRSSKGSIQASEVRHCSPNNGQIQLETTESLPLARSPRRIPFIKPERDPDIYRRMKGQMGQLVPERAIDVAQIGPQEYEPLPG